MRGVEVVYHLGALGSVPRSVQDPLTSNAVNVEGTLNVLLAARDEGVRRVIFSSSTSVYGSSRELPTSETMPPDPISPYGVAKLAAERYCISFSRVYHSFETVALRYFNVFGPRQSPHSQYAAVVPLFIAAIDQGEPITIHGDGEQSRDFTYVGNVVDATLRAASAPGAAPATSWLFDSGSLVRSIIMTQSLDASHDSTRLVPAFVVLPVENLPMNFLATKLVEGAQIRFGAVAVL